MNHRKFWPRVLLTLAFLCALAASALLVYNYIDHSGWILKDGSYFCLDSSGRKLTGLQTLDGVTYYFGSDGAMATGWLSLDGAVRHFGPDGAMDTGPVTIDGRDYCFDRQGRRLSGWLSIGGNRCYYDESGEGRTGWLEDTWYLSADHRPVTGHQVIEGTDYFFDGEGRLSSGWAETDAGLLYFLPGGGIATGLTQLEGRLYNLSETGTVLTGWHTEGEYTYYFTPDGAAVGPTRIDGELHYFTPRGIEVVLVNEWHKIPAYYNPTIVPFVKSFQIAEPARAALQALFDAMDAAGVKYTLNSIYRTRSQQQEILRLRTQEYEDKGYSYAAAYAKARQTVALPDTSEHQLGLAADILGKEANDWLALHCWEYGFILRYPGEKAEITGIINESWHFRYVGTEVSLDMKDTGLCLEEYLGAAAVN